MFEVKSYSNFIFSIFLNPNRNMVLKLKYWNLEIWELKIWIAAEHQANALPRFFCAKFKKKYFNFSHFSKWLVELRLVILK